MSIGNIGGGNNDPCGNTGAGTAARQLIEYAVDGFSHTHRVGYHGGYLVAVDDQWVTVTVSTTDRSRTMTFKGTRQEAAFLCRCMEALRQVNQPVADSR